METIVLEILDSEEDAPLYYEPWVLVLQTIFMHGYTFNSEVIFLANMRKVIVTAWNPTPRKSFEFYISFYLFDVICSSKSFLGMKCH